MVVGQIARAAGWLMVTAELVEVETGRLLGSHRTEMTTVDDIFAVAEALGEDLRRDLRLAAPAEAATADVARALTQSVDAYRAYVRGEARQERADYAGAAAEFREAVRLDPQFALGYYRLTRAAGVADNRSGI